MEKAWQVVIAFVVIFIAGAGTGALITLRVVRQLAPVRPAANTGVIERFTVEQMRNFAAQLDLTKEQREQIRPIVMRAAEDLRRVRQDGFRSTHDILERMQNSVSVLLSPEQLVKFEELRQRQQQRLREMMQERRNRPGAPLPNNRPKAGLEPAAPAETPPAAPGK